MLNMKCNSCDWEGTPNLEETGPHTKALCRKCGKYIKMVSKKELEKLISNNTPEMTSAFKIEWLNVPRACSACLTGNPNERNAVVMIEIDIVKMYLCAHHRKVLIDALNYF